MIKKVAIVALAVGALVGAGGGIATAGPEDPCWNGCSVLPTGPVLPGDVPAPNTGIDPGYTWDDIQRLG